jgi:hypothetical protein
MRNRLLEIHEQEIEASAHTIRLLSAEIGKLRAEAVDLRAKLLGYGFCVPCDRAVGNKERHSAHTGPKVPHNNIGSRKVGPV